MTNNKTILAWIDEMKALVNPDQVVWIDGSEEQLEELRKEAVESGEMIKLNQEKLPGCYLHRTRPNDVARVEDGVRLALVHQINDFPLGDGVFEQLLQILGGLVDVQSDFASHGLHSDFDFH